MANCCDNNICDEVVTYGWLRQISDGKVEIIGDDDDTPKYSDFTANIQKRIYGENSPNDDIDGFTYPSSLTIIPSQCSGIMWQDLTLAKSQVGFEWTDKSVEKATATTEATYCDLRYSSTDKTTWLRKKRGCENDEDKKEVTIETITADTVNQGVYNRTVTNTKTATSMEWTISFDTSTLRPYTYGFRVNVPTTIPSSGGVCTIKINGTSHCSDDLTLKVASSDIEGYNGETWVSPVGEIIDTVTINVPSNINNKSQGTFTVTPNVWGVDYEPLSFTFNRETLSKKLTYTLIDGTEGYIPCDGSDELTYDEINSVREKLLSASIGDCVTTIGDNAFNTCLKLKNINISDSVTKINSSAFVECGNLETIDLSKSITYIGNSAFYDCSKLDNIILSDNITYIGEDAFEQCINLSSINIPQNITTINDYTFAGCTKLTEVEIPNNISTIGGNAFMRCVGLTSVTVNVIEPPTLGTDVFLNTNDCPIYVPCESLNAYKTAINWSSYNSRIYPIEPCEMSHKLAYTLSDGTKGYIDCDGSDKITRNEVIQWKDTLKDVTIGDCITEIGVYAFGKFGNLENLTIPDGITTINTHAFDGCAKLKEVVLPKSINTLYEGAFEYCSGLTSVTVNSIEPPDFNGGIVFNDTNDCPIYVPCESWEKYVSNDRWFVYADRIRPIDGCNKKLLYGLTDGTVSYIPCNGDNKITDTELLTLVNNIRIAAIGNCTDTIGYQAFNGCTKLEKVSIPNGVISIEAESFEHCHNLNNIIIPDSVRTLGAFAFDDCITLSSITLSNSITSIENETFRNCAVIKNIEIPSSVSSMGQNVFNGCTSLSSITVNAIEPPTVTDDTFANSNDCPIYVPCEAITDYRTAVNWQPYVNRIRAIQPCDEYYKMSYTLTNNNNGALRCNGNNVLTQNETSGLTNTIKTVVLGNCVSTIGEGTFANCSGLTSVEISDSITSILGGAFINCVELETITIPNSVTNIGEWAFVNCKKLFSVQLPNNIQFISDSMFLGCQNLKNIDIPSSVKEIRLVAFSGCHSLTGITIPNNVTVIDDAAFGDCRGLTSIKIPNSVTHIGRQAFLNCSSLKQVTVTSTVPPILGSQAFDGTDNNLSIFVPINAIGTYKNAEGWSDYADRIGTIKI